jgi:hypothetical protein
MRPDPQGEHQEARLRRLGGVLPGVEHRPVPLGQLLQPPKALEERLESNYGVGEALKARSSHDRRWENSLVIMSGRSPLSSH